MNYFKYRLTNTASEAFNNKINVIKHRAYGFQDLEYSTLKNTAILWLAII